LAKREADLSLAELREGGTDPRAIVAWAANSAGMSVAERVTAREISPLFAVERFPREPLRLTREALEALTHAS
jgi:hypothetical protein